MGKAVLLTQTMWRKRKNLVPEENLQKIKKDQEVFARAKVVSSVLTFHVDMMIAYAFIVFRMALKGTITLTTMW